MKGTDVSKYSFIDKALSIISRKPNTLQPSLETEGLSNNVAPLENPICQFEPKEIFGRANHRDLLLGAELMQKKRAARAAHFPKEMFGEVAWDIIIALYVKEKNHSLSLTAISTPINVPISTIIRWVTYLEINMLVTTVSVVTDARVRLLQLTDKGRNTMDDCMTELLRI